MSSDVLGARSKAAMFFVGVGEKHPGLHKSNCDLQAS